MSSIKINPKEIERLHKQYLADSRLLHLNKMLDRLYSTAIPKAILKHKDGNIKTIYDDIVKDAAAKIYEEIDRIKLSDYKDLFV